MEAVKRVKPRTLSGFVEYLPKEQIEFNRIKGVIEKHYAQAGFIPQETPLLEASEILLAKAGGETEKQIYRFTKGDTDLSLRFDLTVPLAKYVAMNYGELSFPYKRYQIGKVYRGERAQKGRFREFYQADIDIIGDGILSIINDAEIPSIIYKIFKELDFGKFTIRINNRKILNGFFKELGLSDQIQDILRIIDKIEKIGKEAVLEELLNMNIDKENADKILDFIAIKGSNDEIIQKLEELAIKDENYIEGLNELKEVVKYIRLFNVEEEYFTIDLTIARGLDYYTGTVYETILDEHRELGSICSGGRYENLANYYTNKVLPGVGMSIGLSRLFYQLTEAGIINSSRKTIVEALVIPMDVSMEIPMDIINRLRANDINSAIVFDKKGMKPNLNYANREGIPYVIIVGEDEVKQDKYTLKNMETGEQLLCTKEEIIEKIKNNWQ